MKKLREYKGVTYDPSGVWQYQGGPYEQAAWLIADAKGFTDDDHAALMDLKANPYEPEPLVSTYNLTAADHITALVAMGAKFGSNDVPVTVPVPHHRIGDKTIWAIEVSADRVLILPPEMRDS